MVEPSSECQQRAITLETYADTQTLSCRVTLTSDLLTHNQSQIRVYQIWWLVFDLPYGKHS